VDSKATWRKWCPSPRLDVSEDEFFVDCDVFLLKYPDEIDAVLRDEKTKFAILDEYRGMPFQHGAMRSRASPSTPFVNAGFFLQKAGSDISGGLAEEFDWWRCNVQECDRTHHDEQGALAIALTPYHRSGELFIFPKSTYMIISETSNPGIQTLKGVTLFHATYPTHPAFRRFKNVLDRVLESH
jgi:hypothetical protein